MKIGSLFSGAGGLDMAVEQVFGGTTVWHVENDPAASKVLQKRWPTVPNYGDITSVDWKQVHPVDILCGGWPCQPFSQAGKRLGAEDERALWPHIAGAIRLLRPRYVVLENVSAVLTAGEFSRVADDLASSGYEFGWVCVRASDIGAPHRRERLFILATDTALPERGGPQHQHLAAAVVGAAEPGECFSPSGFGDGDAAVSGAGPVNLLPTPCAQQSGNTPENHLAKKPGRQVVTDLAILEENGLLETGGALPPTPTQSDGTGGGIRTNLSWDGTTKSTGDGGNSRLRDVAGLLQAREMATQWGKYGPAIRRWEQIVGPAPQPTEPNRNGNAGLNPRFSEWMMGWPAGHVTDTPGITRNDQLRIIGNGVVPQQACAALQYLLTLAPATVGV